MSDSLRPWNCSPPGSSVHGILQARILEWGAISSSRGSSRPRDLICISLIIRRTLYHWATWEALVAFKHTSKIHHTFCVPDPDPPVKVLAHGSLLSAPRLAGWAWSLGLPCPCPCVAPLWHAVTVPLEHVSIMFSCVSPCVSSCDCTWLTISWENIKWCFLQLLDLSALSSCVNCTIFSIISNKHHLQRTLLAAMRHCLLGGCNELRD